MYTGAIYSNTASPLLHGLTLWCTVSAIVSFTIKALSPTTYVEARVSLWGGRGRGRGGGIVKSTLSEKSLFP